MGTYVINVKTKERDQSRTLQIMAGGRRRAPPLNRRNLTHSNLLARCGKHNFNETFAPHPCDLELGANSFRKVKKDLTRFESESPRKTFILGGAIWPYISGWWGIGAWHIATRSAPSIRTFKTLDGWYCTGTVRTHPYPTHSNYRSMPREPSLPTRLKHSVRSFNSYSPLKSEGESKSACTFSLDKDRLARSHPVIGASSHEPAHRSEIRLFFRIKNVRDIDVINERFEARWRYFAYFNSDSLKRQLQDDLHKTWAEMLKQRYKTRAEALSPSAREMIPSLVVLDRVRMEITDQLELIVKRRDSVGYDFCITEELHASIAHAFDLRSFPFDVHELSLTIAIGSSRDRELYYVRVEDGGFEDPEERIPFQGAQKGLSPVDFRAGIDTMVGWCIHEPQTDPFPWRYRVDKVFSREVTRSESHPEWPEQVAIQLNCSRHSDYYLTQIMLLSSAIVSCAFATALEDPRDFYDRLQTDLTLLLTTTAFNLSIASQLPALPYQTVLDRHLQMSRAVLFVMIITHGALKLIANSNLDIQVSLLDHFLHSMFALIWGIYHALLLYAARRRRGWIMRRYGKPFSDELVDDRPALLPPLF